MTWPLPPLEFPSYQSEGWILDEDRAVRDLMKGVVVSDHENNQRKVEVWFGHPDLELREQKYPYVTVDLLQVQEGQDRVQRGDLYIKDPPLWWGLAPLQAWQVAYLLEMPTPIDLDYQISTWARNPRHDRQMLFQLITGGRTMMRNGLLYTSDEKIRRVDFLGHIKRDTVEGGKRLFNNVFRLRVSSEVPWGVISQQPQGVGVVQSVHLRMEERIGGLVDQNSLVLGTVVSYDAMTRTADIILGSGSETGVPIVRSCPDLLPQDVVLVGRDPLEQTNGSVSGYRLIVLDLEQRGNPVP